MQCEDKSLTENIFFLLKHYTVETWKHSTTPLRNNISKFESTKKCQLSGVPYGLSPYPTH